MADVEQLPLDALMRLADDFAASGSRTINAVHLHHTWKPDAALFDSLQRRLGSATAAGAELCARMRRVHVEERGWHDIAQHVTADPAGVLWTGRRWSVPPASSKGANGNGSVGPLMIEMIGDFDDGRESPTDAQRTAVLELVASIQVAFDLAPSTLLFHRDLGSPKSCPGSQLDVSDWRQQVAARQKHVRGNRSADGAGRSRSAFAPGFSIRSGLVVAVDRPGAPAQLSDAELLSEPDETGMSSRSADLIAALPGSGAVAHGRASVTGATRGFSRNALRELEPFVINVRKGRLSTGGEFDNTIEDVERRVGGGLRRWIAQRDNPKAPIRIMVHAHGGLNSERVGLEYADAMRRFWIDNDVYPVFIVWETGGVDSLLQIIEQAAGVSASRGRIGDWIRERIDQGLEWLVRHIELDPWGQMKASAKTASSDRKDAGVSVLLDTLGGILSGHPKQTFELHGVGHSAGAILWAHALPAIEDHPHIETLTSLSLLAPACTVKLYRKRIEPAVRSKTIEHFNLFALDRQTELDDSTVPGYSHSLLYLVRDGFERRDDAAILGLQESIDADSKLKRRLGLGRDDVDHVSVVYAPTPKDRSDPLHASQAQTHGGFARDRATISSIAQRIIGRDRLLDDANWPFADTTSRGERRLFATLRDTIDQNVYGVLFADARPSNPPVATAAPLPPPARHERTAAPEHGRHGKRFALCIGINDYGGSADLSGCVNDANAWHSAFTGMGFHSRTLLDRDASHAGILAAMRATIARAGTGDLVAIQYAGHGAWFADRNGDEEDDRDEVLVPADADGCLFIADDELWDVCESAADGVCVYVFMDCCHSATNTRAARLANGVKPRRFITTSTMREAHRQRLAVTDRRSVPRRRGNEWQRHFKYAACGDLQEAMEENGEGRFTRAALSFLRSVEPGTTNASFCEQVLSGFARDANQTPSLDCRPDWRSAPFFGGLFR